MRKLLPLYILLFNSFLSAQSIEKNETILTSFNTYSELPREVVFVHVNKSVFIKGEDLGFKAYVLDKDTKKRSLETNNLYCTISDEKDNVVKEQLIRIQNGVGNGIIKLDSAFTTGTYHFKAYTNWIRNFSEPNYFQQSLTIIDPEITNEITAENRDLVVDAQFLPESGHALEGVNTAYGVIIKDDRGYGFPFLEGEITDKSDNTVARFRLNSFGIGRFGLVPKPNTSYFARFRINNQEFREPIPLIEKQGITATLQDLKDKVGLILNAKFNNQNQRKAPFMLTIHNGDSIKALDISFEQNEQVVKVFPKENLSSGMNVFTVFDSNGTPILERLYFNHQGIKFHDMLPGNIEIVADSVQVSFSVTDMNPAYWNTLSVSILPEETKTYKAHHNLPSYTLLNPYIKGPVENASYYFTNITPRKKYELDNLLLTQGWSSYQWNSIINNAPNYLFDFEKGISYIVTLNGKQDNRFFIYPTLNNESEWITIAESQTIFSKDKFFPVNEEKLGIAEIRKSGEFSQPKIFVRFKPTYIPPLGLNLQNILQNKTSQILNTSEIPTIGFEAMKKLQMLEEVVVVKERDKERIDKIKNSSNGNVLFGEDGAWSTNETLSSFLSRRGFVTNDSNGFFVIRARNPNSPNNATPLIYLDGVLLTDFSVLAGFIMRDVDYVDINLSGIGGGIRGGGGVIKITRSPNYFQRQYANNKDLISYDIPLTFSSSKRYYNPAYNSYNSRFYNSYGAVDWHPDVRIDDEGNGSFTFYNYGLPKVKLFIEGIVNDHEFVSDVKEITIE